MDEKTINTQNSPWEKMSSFLNSLQNPYGLYILTSSIKRACKLLGEVDVTYGIRNTHMEFLKPTALHQPSWR